MNKSDHGEKHVAHRYRCFKCYHLIYPHINYLYLLKFHIVNQWNIFPSCISDVIITKLYFTNNIFWSQILVWAFWNHIVKKYIWCSLRDCYKRVRSFFVNDKSIWSFFCYCKTQWQFFVMSRNLAKDRKYLKRISSHPIRWIM